MLVHNDGFVGSNVPVNEKDYAYLKAAASGSSIDMIFWTSFLATVYPCSLHLSHIQRYP